jgi:oxygen-dependent protoporphyrinogen oxidase
MKKKRIVILGGGISGLSIAWYLSKYSEHLEIVLLEKNERLGGWIRTEEVNGFLFERGPHTFSTSRSQLLRELAIDVGLEKEIIPSQDSAKKRYLYLGGKLKNVPKWPLIKSLFHEWCTPAFHEDESVYAFACRRFSQEVADQLFDPMSLGIYAGDAHLLSVASCFPFFKKIEEKYGSITRGMLATFLKKKRSSPALFTFKEGVGSLIRALKSQIQAEVCCGVIVKGLRFMQDGVEIQTEGKVWKADHLFLALPPRGAKELLAALDPSIAPFFDIPMSHVSVVNMGYLEPVLPLKGFGYLVPTCEKEEVLGVIFDSCIFPQQNHRPHETRLTVLLHQNADSIKIAERALKKHLHITVSADAAVTTDAAIPQYYLGHKEKIKQLQTRIQKNFPRCTLLGNYLEGVSVNDCLAFAKNLSETLII